VTADKTIAFVLYPGCTPLDLIGPLQVMSVFAALRPEYRVVVAAEQRSVLETDTPLLVQASHTFDEITSAEVVIVPGGSAPTLRALLDETLLDFVRTRAGTAHTTASVCTGSLILGAAGLLDSREATTHWSMMAALPEFGATPVTRRWVADGPVLTAAGVAAGIDMALHLCERLADADVARAVQFAIEYDPQPPQGALDWTQAPRELYAPMAAHWLREGLGDHPLRARLAQRLGLS
jgi:transcriptional regulator GlxA family with amidase domain